MAAGNSPGIFGFDPRSIPGCQLWFDATDITTTSNITTTSWIDKSGRGCNATSFNSPAINTTGINSKPAVTFNGSSYFTGATTNTTALQSVFIVATEASGISAGAGLLGFGRAGFPDWNDSGSMITANNNGVSPQMVTTRSPINYQFFTPVFGTPFLFSMVLNGTFQNSYLNGTLNTPPSLAVSSAFAYTNYSIGNRAGNTGNIPWRGFIGEIITYSQGLTNNQRQQIEGYLAIKWGLTGSFPSLHPYFTSGSSLTGLPIAGRLFQPPDLSNLKLWWDSSVPSSFTYTTGSNINTWLDRVSNVPLTYSNTPPTLSATGGVYMSNPSSAISAASQILVNSNVPGLVVTQRNTVIVAHYPLSTDNYRSAFVMVAPYTFTANPTFLSSVQCGINEGNGVGSYNGAGTWYSLQQAAYCNSVAPRVDSLLSDASNFVYTNGVEGSYTVTNIGRGTFTTGSTTSQIAVVIGGTSVIHGAREYNGYIYEMLFYDTTLSFSDLRRVEGYLANKWKFQSNLVSTHPYYRIPPTTAAPFDPKGIPGCQLWLDAADTSSFSFSSGSNVSVWRDKSGNANNATASGTVPLVQNAVNGNSALSFSSAIANYLLGSVSVPTTTMSVFAVSTQTTGGGQSATGRIISLAATAAADYNNNAYCFIGRVNTGNSIGAYRNNVVLGNISISPTTAYVSSSIFNGANYTEYVFGSGVVGTSATTASTGIFAVTGYGIGQDTFTGDGNGAWNGYICEVIVYRTALTEYQRQQVEGYLAWKWQLRNFLPSNHPYYSFSPEVSSTPSIVSTGLILDLNPTTYVSGTTWVPSLGNTWNLVSGPTVSPGLTFDGTTVLTVNGSSSYIYDPTGVNFTGAFSMDIWVFVPTPSTNGNIFAETNGGYQWTTMYISNSTFYGAPYQIGNGGGQPVPQSLGTCTANKWTNLCITSSASGTSTYVGYSNGIQMSTTSYNRVSPGANSFYYLASSAGNPNFGYKALSVGAIKFYNIALTSTQVKQNYDALYSRFILDP